MTVMLLYNVLASFCIKYTYSYKAILYPFSFSICSFSTSVLILSIIAVYNILMSLAWDITKLYLILITKGILYQTVRPTFNLKVIKSYKEFST